MDEWEGKNDNVLASIISECLYVMRIIPTKEKVTVCFNLLSRILRLFSVLGTKDDVIALIQNMCDDLKEGVEEDFKE